MVCIRTERLIVRDARETDFPAWHHLISDPNGMYYLEEILTKTEEESRENLKKAMEEAKNPNRTEYFFAALRANTEEFIGSIGYTVEKDTNMGKIAHAGYFFLQKYHGKGYASEAFQAVLRFAFEEDNVFLMKTGCLKENKASERVMQKCGLIKEGEYPAAQLHNGQMKDRIHYEITREEWLKLLK